MIIEIDKAPVSLMGDFLVTFVSTETATEVLKTIQHYNLGKAILNEGLS